jgi:DNA polymerase-3 subunit gamma/tau
MKEPHLALYRKYRPQTFDEVVGQADAVNLLTSAIKQKKVAHAYLFVGGRGTGKTTVARIVAKELGCNQEDIIEIDAASNRGIEEVRELREAVRTAPFSSPYKVYILDEAHMLTKEAANALLKTLEEPPAHVIFILATTDPQKLPTTIVSRTQKIVFHEPDTQTLATQLICVAEKEGYTLPPEGAEAIARHGKGSYRDALGILEQTLAVSNKKISVEDITSRLGEPSQDEVLALVQAMCEKNPQSLIKSIRALEKSGISALRAYDDIIQTVRLSLLVRVGVEPDMKDKELLASYKNLSATYPHTIASKTLLELLKQRELVEVSAMHAWTAVMAILVAEF